MNLSHGIHPVVLLSAFAVLWFLCLFCMFPIGLGADAIRKPARR